MIETLINNPTPVNRSAASLFWKSPWWARFEEDEKNAVMETEAKIEELQLIDKCRPPVGNIKDRRGDKIEWGGGEKGFVTGFHDIRKKVFPGKGRGQSWVYMGKCFSSNSSDATEIVSCRWWVCILGTGEFRLINFAKSSTNWNVVGRYSSLSRVPDLELMPWELAPVKIKLLIMKWVEAVKSQDGSYLAIREQINSMGYRLHQRGGDVGSLFVSQGKSVQISENRTGPNRFVL